LGFHSSWLKISRYIKDMSALRLTNAMAVAICIALVLSVKVNSCVPAILRHFEHEIARRIPNVLKGPNCML